METSSLKTRTIKLVVEYDGTLFKGMQIQPGCRTVQGAIENALKDLTGETIRIKAAGRTDTGVHARGQVIGFNTMSGLQVRVFRDGLNAHLPEDIRVLDSEEVPDTFNARKKARRRTYRYIISKIPRAVGRQYCWYPNSKLDLSRMKKAAHYLKGKHDFSSFSKADGDLNDYVTRILRIRWTESDESIVFEIEGERFFHNMVRIIIGTLVEVGTGKRRPEEMRDILYSRDRRMAGATAPPHGLHLVCVDYD